MKHSVWCQPAWTGTLHGEFENPLLLFSPVSAKKYLAVSKDSIDIIEMK